MDAALRRFSYKTSTVELRRRIAEVFQHDLSRCGLGLDVRSYEWATFYEDIRRGNFELYALAWVGVRGWLAKGELEAAAATAADLQKQVVAGATADAGDTAERLVGHTREASGLTGDPIWRLADAHPAATPACSRGMPDTAELVMAAFTKPAPAPKIT